MSRVLVYFVLHTLFFLLLLRRFVFFFFFSSRRRHTRSLCDWSSDVCSSDLELSASGRVARRFSVLDGLGESDLTCMAAYDGRLYIGTRSRGLLAFDGERFERYWWPDRDAQSVTALFVDQGKLLVGTFAGGLLEFDGEGFHEVRAGEERTRLN